MQYATVNQVKDSMLSSYATDVPCDDARLAVCLDAAQESVDAYCGQSFGSVVPAAVTQATIQWTLRLFKRVDTPLGYGGGPETGLLYVSRQIDGDVANLLAPHRTGVLAAGGFA